jgi:GxxExxY protein
MTADDVAKDIVDAAIKVHRALGPGLLESAYQACLAHELRRRQRRVECEVALPLQFEGVLIEVGYRIDMRVDQLVLVENKTVEKILAIHLAQLLTYLKLSGLSLGLIINWNVILLRDGIQRVVRNHPDEPTSGGDRTILFLAPLAFLAFGSAPVDCSLSAFHAETRGFLRQR